MSLGRHSYIAFYPSDWKGGTSHMPRLYRSVFMDICLYIWDHAKPCPASELPLILGDLDGWKDIVQALVDAGKLERLDDGSLSNDRAMAEAQKALSVWKKASEGGRRGAGKRWVKNNTPNSPPNAPPNRGANGVPNGGGNAEPEPEPELLDKSNNKYSGEFLEFWKCYPKRHTASDKAGAYRAWNGRIKAGHSKQEMIDGARRYFEYCQKTDKIGTEYVKLPATFLSGRSDPPEFKKEWSYEKRPSKTGRASIVASVAKFQTDQADLPDDWE